MNETPTTSLPLLLSPSTTKPVVDEFIVSRLTLRRDQAQQIEPSYAYLWQAILDLFQAGGKRLRPFMTIVAFQAFSDAEISAVLPAAAAEELLHLAMLIHDDIIDRDTIRYGVKNISGSFYEHYETLVHNERDRHHFSDSAAILAGDLLIAEAFTLLAESDCDTECILAATKILHTSIFGVVGGELLDTEASFKKLASAPPLLIAEYKTASYSFVGPLTLGATLAGATETDLQGLKEYAKLLGIGYQIRDDVIGVFGDETVTGKSTDSDITEGKRTILTDEFLRLATPEQKELYRHTFGNHHATDEAITALKIAFKESGALDATEVQISHFAEQAAVALAQLTIPAVQHQALAHLITLCTQRDK